MALRIEAHVRPRDNIGRFAGDEFLVLIEDVSEDQVMTIAQRIHESVKNPIHVDDKTVHIETSIGITMSGNADDAKGLIDIADKAMYKAKRQHKCLCLLTRSKQIYK